MLKTFLIVVNVAALSRQNKLKASVREGVFAFVSTLYTTITNNGFYNFVFFPRPYFVFVNYYKINLYMT